MTGGAVHTPPPVRAWRLLRVALHILWGFVVVAAVWPWRVIPWRRAATRRWCRQLLRILHIRLEVRGTPPGSALPAGMLIPNHVSWLDMLTLNCVEPGHCITRGDVQNWPVVGWLVRASGSVFIDRNQARDMKPVIEEMERHIRAGRNIVFFPEGTTTDGRRLTRFATGLLQAAIELRAPLYPVSIRHLGGEDELGPATVFIGEMTFVESMCRIARCPEAAVILNYLPPVPSADRERHDLGRMCRELIARDLGLALPAPETQEKTAATPVPAGAF